LKKTKIIKTRACMDKERCKSKINQAKSKN
jgi:hypothetical protein